MKIQFCTWSIGNYINNQNNPYDLNEKGYVQQSLNIVSSASSLFLL